MGTVSRGPGIFSGFSVLLSPSLKANSKKIDFPRSFLSCALTVCAAVTAQCRIHDNDPIDGNKSLSVVDCGLVMFMATIEIVCPTLHDSEGALSSSFFLFFFGIPQCAFTSKRMAQDRGAVKPNRSLCVCVGKGL